MFYKPDGGWIGDVIPFYEDGVYWLYYLHARRTEGVGTSWHLLRTSDFVQFDDVGEVLPHGDESAPDFHAYTGSVIRHDDTYHLFYTGQNPAIERDGAPLQAVMHAVSRDLVTWEKRPADTFYAPDGLYEPHDWRDPHVFADPRTGGYGMLLAARRTEGSDRRRGCIGWCSSSDLTTWEPGEPFWSPGLYMTHECPDLFRLGDWWYLVFSEFSERFTTRYRMSRSLDGPWEAPVEDTLDGRGFYAAKTAGDEQGRRFAFGWIPTKAGETDDGAWEWAGQLAVHELAQNPDGTLAVRLPATIRDAFAHHQPAELDKSDGDWRAGDAGSAAGAIVGTAPGTVAAAHAAELPDRCLLSGTVTVEPGSRACGVLLRTGPEPDTGYVIRLEPHRDRMVFDRWPRSEQGEEQWQIDGDVAHVVELERAVALDPGRPYRLEVLVDGSACTAYLDGQVAMSARMYDRRSGGWGLFVREGTATFTDWVVRTSR